MTVIDIDGETTELSRLVDQAAAGEEVLIARGGTPVARLVAVEASPPTGKRVLGQMRGQFKIPEDFDTMFQADIDEMFYGR